MTVSFVYGIDSWFESPFISRTFPFSEKVEFDLNLEPVKNSSKVTFENIPREMRILCVLCAELEEKSYPVAWTQIYFINDNGRVNTGVQELILYPISRELARSMKKDKTGVWDMLVLMSHGNATTGGRGSVDPGNGVFGTLSLVMNTFDSPVHRLEPDSELRIISNFWKPDQHKLGPEVPFNRLPKESQQSINQICSKSILFPLTSSEKELIWLARHSLVTKPEALPRFLQTVDWTDFDHKMEAYRLLKLWKFPQSLAEIIELLGAEFPDTIVRGFAVSQLYTFDKFDIRKFIPQLIQALKFELCHWSKLSEFLLIQSISDPFIIGIELLWYLKFEMLRPMHAERFGLLAEAILSLTGPFAWEFCKQHVIVSRLQMIAQMVSSSNERGVPKKEVMKMYKKQMIHFNEQVLNEIGGWRNPLNALFTLSQLNVEKCRYMSSKMAPLWLNIKSSDSHGKNTNIILKVGDDLRQDILVLQMLRAFESCWRSNDLDFQLSPYACLQTGVTQQGRGVGLIEVVGNAETTSRIHWEYGGRFGALQRETLCKYLEQFNGTPQLYESAVDIFTRSCAGYCIATFILGIGDRHNGNIMIKEDGHLFHIDFGHILGNFKSKVGINRERAAFVFTPEMAYIIGRKSKSYRKDANYKRFIQLCLEGYQSLRDKTRQWIAMVRMMLPAGIPELRKRDDITYMLNMLMEGSLPSEAIKRLEAEIDKSVNTKMRVFDNLVHTWVHEG